MNKSKGEKMCLNGAVLPLKFPRLRQTTQNRQKDTVHLREKIVNQVTWNIPTMNTTGKDAENAEIKHQLTETVCQTRTCSEETVMLGHNIFYSRERIIGKEVWQ